MDKKPFAVLLCKFNGESAEPYPRRRYEEIFTPAGAGMFNMVDYFRDMSHGAVDISGSKVFGWYTLDQERSDYHGHATEPNGRDTLIDWARAKAANKGVPLSDFHSTIVCMNVDTDLFGSPYGVVCDDGRWEDNIVTGFSSMSPCILGQEMGHALGLEHSRIIGGSDYTDPWDIMSTAATPFMAPHPVYSERDVRGRPIFRIGPGLNAANMAHLGWLDANRVWAAPMSGPFSAQVRIRPLHRRDLAGPLAIRLGEYFVEFRTNALWDAEIDQPCVLVHTLDEGVSTLMLDQSGNAAMLAGSKFGTPVELSVFGSGVRIAVKEIDADAQTADIMLARTGANIPRVWPKEGPYLNPGVAWLDQLASLVNARTLLVSQTSKLSAIADPVGVYEMSKSIADPHLRRATRISSLKDIVAVADQELRRLQEPRVPGKSGLRS